MGADLFVAGPEPTVPFFVFVIGSSGVVTILETAGESGDDKLQPNKRLPSNIESHTLAILFPKKDFPCFVVSVETTTILINYIQSRILSRTFR